MEEKIKQQTGIIRTVAFITFVMCFLCVNVFFLLITYFLDISDYHFELGLSILGLILSGLIGYYATVCIKKTEILRLLIEMWEESNEKDKFGHYLTVILFIIVNLPIIIFLNKNKESK